MNEMKNGNSKIPQHSLAGLSLAALGVVFGDIGTSPLYAVRECFHGEYAIEVTRGNILGVLSLMFWSLTLIVSIKYLSFVFLADNKGEGGVFALTAMIKGIAGKPKHRRLFLISLGLFAASLLYGDGMITPAISVLSASEGLRVIAPELQRYVIPLTMVILAGLFILQQRGTAKIGVLFGPVTFVWFVVLAILGSRQIIQNPNILYALSPTYAINFLLNSGLHGFTVLGAVFLVVTGTEALYADLGHFGRKPIRLVWFWFVGPALLLSYFGQGAVLLANPAEAHHPFYAMVPGWAVVPMVVLSTFATIIASQAVITGVFSLTHQAIQMGYLPRLKVVHTSSRHYGQIYVPQVNWLMMIATLGLVLGFQSSSKLAAAYGVAVTVTMLISSLLFYAVARSIWKWSRLAAGLPVLIFIIIDSSFFLSNISKLMHGAWFPIVLGGLTMWIMTTWSKGRRILAEELRSLAIPFQKLQERLKEEKIERARGQAVFLTAQPQSIPVALVHNLEHNRIVHANVFLLNFSFTQEPRVPNQDKLQIEDLGSGFKQITASYGFMEHPSLPKVLALASGQGLKIMADQTSYFLGREKLVIGQKRKMNRWRAQLFTFLSRNAYDASTYFEIPEDRVIEIGVRLTL